MYATLFLAVWTSTWSSFSIVFGKTVSWTPELQVLVDAFSSAFLCCSPVARSLMTKCLSEGLTRSDPWITFGTRHEVARGHSTRLLNKQRWEKCDRVVLSVFLPSSFREMTRVISSASAQGPSGPEGASVPREVHTSL